MEIQLIVSRNDLVVFMWVQAIMKRYILYCICNHCLYINCLSIQILYRSNRSELNEDEGENIYEPVSLTIECIKKGRMEKQ